MKKFRVRIQTPMIQTFVYEVEAKEGIDALTMVFDEDKSVELVARDLQEEPSFGDEGIKVEEID